MKIDFNIIMGIMSGILLFILMYCCDKRKQKNEKRFLVTLDSYGKKYKGELAFTLVTGEIITLSGYTDREHKNINEFIGHCDRIEEKNTEYVITQEEITYLPKHSIIKTEIRYEKLMKVEEAVRMSEQEDNNEN